MAGPPSRFEQIISDAEAFRVMLDGAFKDWDGTYQIWLADTKEFLFGPEQAFYDLLSSKPDGERRYRAHAESVTSRFLQNDADSLSYTCEVTGLKEVALPIRAGGELVAVLFCNQTWPQDRQAEDVTVERIKRITGYVSKLGADWLALNQARQQDLRRLEALRALQTANHRLHDLSISWDAFWHRTEQLLADLVPIIGALCGLVLVPGRGKRRDIHIATAVHGLPPEVFAGRVYRLDDGILDVIASPDRFHILHPPDHDLARGPVRQSITDHAPEMGAQLGREVLIPMFLEDQRNGLVLFFLSNDLATAEGRLAIDSTSGDSILAQSGAMIGGAFNNRLYVQRRQQQHKFKRAWLETVTHQFVAPLSAVQGHAELLQNRLSRWEAENPRLFHDWTERNVEQLWNSLTAMERTAQYASRLAYNFSRVVYQGKELGEDIEFSVAEDLTGVLIQIARDFQGSAREQQILKVEVDTASLAVLKGKVSIITTDDLFRQAIGNLIDNAVKYSHENTAIIIQGRMDDKWGVIEVVNEGIRLAPGEEERIFEYEYRTAEARATYAPGTGIGLSVARDIIGQHGGTLTARPSVPTRKSGDQQSWRTTFTIRLPLLQSGRT